MMVNAGSMRLAQVEMVGLVKKSPIWRYLILESSP
jgi:hypothetical protein